MSEGPSIARIAGAIGDRARAEILTALMTDRALTASELGAIAGVTKQTISAHLAKLLQVKLVEVAQDGRHRYFRLAGPDVAEMLETMMGVAFRTGAVRLRSSPREPALRKARICYDHLAGELGVLAYESLLRRKIISTTAQALVVSNRGRAWFRSIGVDVDGLARARRALCRPCLDWSERRMHLAGSLGQALLDHAMQRRWARRVTATRIVAFSVEGERVFRKLML
jgi:DNA-binding transcriptional ArsR family regulator